VIDAGRPLGAVVFDLYGTLVPEIRIADWDAMFERMASELRVDLRTFRREWDATIVERQTGRLASVRENLRVICRRMRIEPEGTAIERALEVRTQLYRTLFHPQPEAVETLGWLRGRGTPTALVSVCAPDTPALWHASPFEGLIDVLVFSSEAGVRKPDPRIYLRACAGLGVEPDVCLYVGDASYELWGAAAVGMSPVLIRGPAEGDGMVLRPQADPWEGETIASLTEVRRLLGAP
jgi:putative hydrolase of the HAD superfamily